MEKLFHLKENHTTWKTEILAGITTFMTMAYIIALNPNLLTGFQRGTALWNAVFMATCLSSAIGTMCMAFWANQPFVMSSGMGLNSFFATIVSNVVAMTSMDYTSAFQAMLSIILLEGIVFLVLSLFNVREKLVQAIPKSIRMGISPAIGMMLLNIGFGSNVGIYAEGNGYTTPFYVLRDFFGAMTPSILRDGMGAEYSTMVLSVITILLGLLSISLLRKKGIKAAAFLGMMIASAIYWAGEAIFLHVNPFESLRGASFVPPFADMFSTTFFKFNFAGLAQIGWSTVLTLIITFCIIDMFDTIGTLIGTASTANMLDEHGNMPRMKQALLADAVGTIAGAFCGTSTITTFSESAAGVGVGGRTGMTAFVAALLFLCSIFLAPLMALIPSAAASVPLIYVGISMLQGLKLMDFDNMEEFAPVALMLITIPISGSIGHGIGLGMIAYTAIKLCGGKGKEVSILTYAISILFLIKFFVIL